ncbi:MAG: hypothetical protein NTZ34_03295 [Chloroflexi bacterium]|nr:hypothetical protein [Chloroflexota bacterium]
MTTLTSMRTLVRRDLKDEDSSEYRWTDNEIDRAIERAVLEYSEYCPLQVKSTVATVDASPDVTITTLTDRIDVMSVEHPAGEYPAQYHRFKLWANILTFIDGHMGDAGNCYVYWLQKHTLSATSSIPTAHDGIIALGAAAFAISAQAQYTVEQGTVLGPKVNKDYNYWAKEKFAQFYEKLEAIKSYNTKRLKVTQMSPEPTTPLLPEEHDV